MKTPNSPEPSRGVLVDPKTLKNHPKAALVPEVSQDQYATMLADVRIRGFQDPALVNQDDVVVDGHTRKRVAEELHIPLLIERRTLTPEQEMQHLVLDNLSRRHLTASQRAAMLSNPQIITEVLAPFEAAARERMRKGGEKGRRTQAAGQGEVPEAALPQAVAVRAPQVRDRVAARAGVSGRLLSMSRQAWEKAPEEMQAIISGASSKTICNVCNEIRKKEKAAAAKAAIGEGAVEFEKLFKLQHYDVWTFQGIDPGFGKVHPGNIPASLVANVLYYFTEPGAFVVDPMAGGGVTGDVCRALGRNCIMADLHPHKDRDDIMQHRIEDGPVPGTEGKADLVFVDPPYWSMNDDKYGPGSASSKSKREWMVWLRTMAANLAATAKPGGIVAVLMQDNLTKGVDDTWSHPSVQACAYELATARLVPVILIACPLPYSQPGWHDLEWAKANKRLLGINRQLLVYRKREAQ